MVGINRGSLYGAPLYGGICMERTPPLPPLTDQSTWPYSSEHECHGYYSYDYIKPVGNFLTVYECYLSFPKGPHKMAKVISNTDNW